MSVWGFVGVRWVGGGGRGRALFLGLDWWPHRQFRALLPRTNSTRHAPTRAYRNDLPGLWVCAIEDEETRSMFHKVSDNVDGVTSRLATSNDSLLADDVAPRARFALSPAADGILFLTTPPTASRMLLKSCGHGNFLQYTCWPWRTTSRMVDETHGGQCCRRIRLCNIARVMAAPSGCMAERRW